MKRVIVQGAPGFEDFEADLLGELYRIDEVLVSIVVDDEKEMHVIESRYVSDVHS